MLDLLSPCRRARRTLLPLLISLAVLVGGGCSHEVRPIRVAIHNDLLSLDPHAQNEILTFSVLSNVYDGLTVFREELKVAPNLAEGWENPDQKTWRFHLRPDAVFHDGRPVEAADVVFSLERARSGLVSNLSSFFVEVDRISEIDRRTVEITTRRPSPVLLNKLASVCVVPRNSPQRITTPIGSGAYRLVSYEPRKALVMDPASNWHNSNRSPLPLVFLPVRDPIERVDRLLRGEVDILQDLQPSEIDRVVETAGFRIASHPSLTVEYLFLHAADPRFSDRRVREAIHLALDRAKLIEIMFRGYGLPASQMVGPGVFGFNPDLSLPPRDVQRARQLLAEAGYLGGLDLTLEYRSGRRGEEIAKQLGDAGIRVTPASSDWRELYPRLVQRSVPFYYGGVAATTADASDVYDSFVHTQDLVKGYGQTNFNMYSNPEIDREIEVGTFIFDQRERRAHFQRIMAMLMADLYFIPLFVTEDIYALRDDIEWQPRLDRMLLGREMGRTKR